MKKLKTTKYRFIFSLNELDFAFERLFIEMISIDCKFSDDTASINRAKRKLFLKILLAYCNQRVQPFQPNAQTSNSKHISSQSLEVVPNTESTADPPSTVALPPTPTPPSYAMDADKEEMPNTGPPLKGDIISFGEFKLAIK